MTSSLSTARLQLAAPTPADAVAILAIAGDPRAVEHNPSDLLTDLTEAQDLLGRWIRHWLDRGFGYWCVREVGRPRVVGYCGLKASTAKGLSVLNLIYRFTPDVWGRGYATEAATAAIAWGTEHQPSTLILARVRPANVASQNVALKVGLRRDHGMDDEGEDGLDLAYTTRPRTTEWVQLELPTDIALPASPTLPAGVSLASIAELGDTEQLRRRVYELNKECAADIPGRGEFFSYDEYIQRRFAADGYQPEGAMLALDGDALVGLCVISYVPGREWAFIEMTGVRRSHRRRGCHCPQDGGDLASPGLGCVDRANRPPPRQHPDHHGQPVARLHRYELHAEPGHTRLWHNGSLDQAVRPAVICPNTT